MELKIGLKYTCENNGPDWHGEIINIGNEIVQVDLFHNNVRTSTGSDPIKKILKYFETGYFKIKEDFVLPEKWCVQDYQEVTDYSRTINNYGISITSHGVFCVDTITNNCCWSNINQLENGKVHEYTLITFEEFQKYVLKQSLTTNYTKLINILKYIDERTRTLT
jgi:hypothetical protein